jgi:hypothetical protein
MDKTGGGDILKENKFADDITHYYYYFVHYL